MKSSLIERKLIAKIEARLPGAAPGLRLQVHQGGAKICDIAAGATYPYYDLASLTKIIFTVPALMAAYEKGLWDFETTVGALWPSFPAPDVTIVELLTHTAGALWWFPFYKEVDLHTPEKARRAWLKQKLENLDWMPAGECVYSDVGMLALGFCLEALLEKPLPAIWRDLKDGMYSGMPALDFHYGNQVPAPQSAYAPTELCPWRGRLLQGEVHDENAWSFGGVSSHAGLFGGIGDVSAYGLFLRSQRLGIGKTHLSSGTVKAFTNRALPPQKGDWALGFMVPAASGASCGSRFSPHSIGHTGFTGTSVWYDPAADLLVVILSNRVHLGREREDFKLLRPEIHNWVSGLISG